MALGHEHAGLFSNDDALAGQLAAAGLAVGEKLWRMPMADAYDKLIDRDRRHEEHRRPPRRLDHRRAVPAALRRDGVPWAHLDIAGTAWSAKDAADIPKGATAFGVRLLDRLVATHYEV